MRNVRFRTLGCYPLTGAIESTADDARRTSFARRCRRASPNARAALIDQDGAASMERKKQEGYF